MFREAAGFFCAYAENTVSCEAIGCLGDSGAKAESSNDDPERETRWDP